MKMIDVLHMPRSIWLGRKTEQNFRPIAFDVYKWVTDYPEATVSIVYTRPDGQVFPVASSDKSPIIWIPQQDVTAVSGEGEIELHLVGGGSVGISASTKALIDDSASSAQPTAPSWVDRVVQDVTEQADRAEEASEHYPKIISGVWYVWSVSDEDFVSTGISAQGEDGVSPTATVEAIDGGHRVTITDADGAHTFDVMDGEGGSAENAVLYTPMNLTPAQQEQARENLDIEYMTSEDIDELWESTDGVPAESGSVATPEMFGAKGDGVTDDTAAIQAAIDSGASVICFGSGKTYLVSKANSPTLYPDHDEPCVYLHDKQNMTVMGNNAVLKVEEHGQGVLEITNSENIRVCDLRVSGHGAFPPIAPNGRGEKGDASGGYYKSGYDWESHKNNSVDTSKFKGVNGNADTEWGTFGGGYIGNVGIGFLIEDGCRDICLENCSSDGFNYSGFSVGFRGRSDFPYNRNIAFRRCVVSGCYDNGFNLLLADGVVIQNCDIEDIGHTDALPTDAETSYPYAYADPGYGVTCRKPYTSASRAKNVKVVNSHIKKCVRKGVDSHSADGFLVQNNTIELCYYAGIDLAEGVTESTLTYNAQITDNLLRYCGLLNGAIRASIYTGDASFNPDDYEINNIIADNILVNCACANYGIIYVRIGKNTRISGNIISGVWSLADLSLLSGIYAGQREKACENICISGNEISVPTGKINYPIHTQNLKHSMISGNIANVYECGVTIYAYGDIVNDVSVIGNIMAADTYVAPSAFSTTTGAVVGNRFPGDNPGNRDIVGKRISGEYTVSSGFFRVTDSAVLPTSVLVISQKYSNGTAVGVLFTAQCGDGYANIYVRNPDSTIPADGSIVAVNMLVVNE